MSIDDIIGARLFLRHVPPEALTATIAGNLGQVSRLIGLQVPSEWTDLAPLALRRLKQIEDDPAYLPWSIRAMALIGTTEVIGYANFHEQPGSLFLQTYSPRAVELGYTIVASHRRRGYGGEAVRMLIKWASERSADGFVFSISPGNAASLALVAGLGAVKVGSQIDEEDGQEDVYLLLPSRRRDDSAGIRE